MSTSTSTSTHAPARRPGPTPRIRTTDRDRERERERCKRSGCHWPAVIDAADGLCILCHERAARPPGKRYAVCLMPDCDRPHKAQGLCDTHYWRVRNHSPTPVDQPIRPKAPSLKERERGRGRAKHADVWRHSMALAPGSGSRKAPEAPEALSYREAARYPSWNRTDERKPGVPPPDGNTGSVPVPPPGTIPSTAGKVKVSDRRKPELRAAPPGGWPRTCSRPGCERKHEANGLCRAHYERERRKRKRHEERHRMLSRGRPGSAGESV